LKEEDYFQNLLKSHLKNKNAHAKANTSSPKTKCNCGGPCAGGAEAAEYIVEVLNEYTPHNKLIPISTKSKTLSAPSKGLAGKATNGVAKTVGGLGDFLKNNKVDKVESSRMRGRKRRFI